MKNIFSLSVILLLFLFYTNCKKTESSAEVIQKEFGLGGTHNVSKFTPTNDAYTSVYYPSDIATMTKKTPIVFFISGWSTTSPASKYESLLSFMTSHGYTVIFTNQGAVTNAQYAIDKFDALLDNQEQTYLNDIKPFIDTTRIGIIGHSAGGGTTLTTLKYYAQPNKNFGANGRFILQLDPWYAFDMSENDIKTLPNNINLILLKFGVGGNNPADGTDARIPLTIYSLLESIPEKNKDYQIYDKENADHTYPYGNKPYAEMQGILKPLDALMDYTFVEQLESTRVVALENGSDHPYADGLQIILNSYQYPCDGASTIIDYCAIVP